MTRGIDKMDIYHDKQDRLKYLDILQKVKQLSGCELYAFCLMTNHTHLLIKELDTEISKILGSIGIRYAMYFNKKYGRIGSLFQDRFRSETIRSEPQLLACARYIHNNPVKAGMADYPDDYRWSSYRGYLSGDMDLLDSDYLLSALDSDMNTARIQIKKFTLTENEDRFIEFEPISDSVEENREQVGVIIAEHFKLCVDDVKNLKKKERDAVIAYLKANTDLSCRELADVLEISKDIVYRA